MTAVMGADHKLAFSADVVAQGRLTDGMQFRVSVTPSGSMILRPSRPRRKSLVEHLRGMQGLEPVRESEMLGQPLSL